ncbi:MAG: epoxyqueuosine reductase [Leptospirales bacterium]
METLEEFPLAAILGDPAPRPDYFRLEEWLDRGDHGEMEYLSRTAVRRRSLGDGYPGYRSMVIAILPFGNAVPLLALGETVRLAGYARGPDYHRIFEEKFRRVRDRIRNVLDPGDRPLIKPDHGSLLEKSLAAEAGLGAIGKNTLLINPLFGSRFTIGSLLLKTPLDTLKAPFSSFSPCGSCRRCLDACPTSAFRGPFQLNATRCLSYLTVEKPHSLTAGLRMASEENWLFGCDVCQDVCPHNHPRGTTDGVMPDRERHSPDIVNSWEDLIQLVDRNPSLGRVSPEFLWERLQEIAERKKKRQ